MHIFHSEGHYTTLQAILCTQSTQSSHEYAGKSTGNYDVDFRGGREDARIESESGGKFALLKFRNSMEIGETQRNRNRFERDFGRSRINRVATLVVRKRCRLYYIQKKWPRPFFCKLEAQSNVLLIILRAPKLQKWAELRQELLQFFGNLCRYFKLWWSMKIGSIQSENTQKKELRFRHQMHVESQATYANTL